jgi:hypothetical protein
MQPGEGTLVCMFVQACRFLLHFLRLTLSVIFGWMHGD